MAFDIRRFDVYRKLPKDLTQPTFTGAVISIGCLILITFLFISEVFDFISIQMTNELFVDNDSYYDKIPVHLNISLPNLSCLAIGLDIQDDRGRHDVGFRENSKKFEINNGYGCRFEGVFGLNKVSGNFHISTHSLTTQPEIIDMSHTIHDLTFGYKIHVLLSLEGSFNPLKDMNKAPVNTTDSHEYHLKLVPTVYVNLKGFNISSYQYSYAYKSKPAPSYQGQSMPAIWFHYDWTPITVKYIQKRKPFYEFITLILAIIGGTFTVAGLIDSVLFGATNILKKIELGKMN